MSKLFRYIFGLLFLRPKKVENKFVFDLMSYDVLNNLEILTYLMDNYVMNYAVFPSLAYE